jgi:hypothetical protein
MGSDLLGSCTTAHPVLLIDFARIKNLLVTAVSHSSQTQFHSSCLAEVDTSLYWWTARLKASLMVCIHVFPIPSLLALLCSLLADILASHAESTSPVIHFGLHWADLLCFRLLRIASTICFLALLTTPCPLMRYWKPIFLNTKALGHAPGCLMTAGDGL